MPKEQPKDWVARILKALEDERERNAALTGGAPNPHFLNPGEDPRPFLEQGRPVMFSDVATPPLLAAYMLGAGGKPVEVPPEAFAPSPYSNEMADVLPQGTAPNPIDALLATLLSGAAPSPAAGSPAIPPQVLPPAIPPPPAPVVGPGRLYRWGQGDTMFYGNMPQKQWR